MQRFGALCYCKSSQMNEAQMVRGNPITSVSANKHAALIKSLHGIFIMQEKKKTPNSESAKTNECREKIFRVWES